VEAPEQAVCRKGNSHARYTRIHLEDLNEQPIDIDWALSDGRFFIVQARPITTLRGQTPALEEWNDSLSCDYLWSCANVGEAVPDVMIPCTWSLIQLFLAKTMGAVVSHRPSLPPLRQHWRAVLYEREPGHVGDRMKP
jgi:hypothetical protein